MAYTIEQIETLLNDAVNAISIDDKLFAEAEEEYTALGKWIDKKISEEGHAFSVDIFPQGSFALGTVNKPVTENDDYDLDLVCELTNANFISAYQLKISIVKKWLENYRRHMIDIEEKRRCWHVEYDELPEFHMDVIPARSISIPNGTLMQITNKDEVTNAYSYIGSNPRGYINWFFTQCNKTSNSEQYETNMFNAEQEELKRHKRKSKLQKAIQIMKRHRDIMFQDEPDLKPVSIVITTLAAQIYKGELTIIEIIDNFSKNVQMYLESTKKNGDYSIPNPSFDDEDFADKWKKHPERKGAFFRWIAQLHRDLSLEAVQLDNRVEMGNRIKSVLGEKIGIYVFTVRGISDRYGIEAKQLKVDTRTGNISDRGDIAIPENHHHGEN